MVSVVKSSLPVKVLVATFLACACLQQYKDLNKALVNLTDIINEKEIVPVDCMKVRGEYGEWVQDYEYAAQVQYTPLLGFRQRQWDRKHKQKFANNEFLPQTTYAWNETKYPQCQIQVMTKNGFCSILNALNITNVYMAGDSMMHEMWMSFIGILGLEKDVEEGNTMRCPGNFTFRLFFDRTILASIPPPPTNSSVNIDKWGQDSIKVVPDYGQVAISQCPLLPSMERTGVNTPRLYKYVTNNGACPWVKEYESLQGRTLLVVNAGAAYHATETFNLMFDTVVEALDNVTKRADLAFFRSTSPAHHDCFNNSLYQTAPLSHFDEYVNIAETSHYSWNLFKFYNEYAQNRLTQREGRKDLFPLRYLNIFNMTALRHDGHKAANDCLHYELPAVVDWWNHMLFTSLSDIAAQESKVKH